MPDYVAYGCVLHSEFELPGLRVAPAAATATRVVEIVRGPVSSAPREGSWYSLSAQHSQLVWSGVGRVSIEHGQRVVVAVEGPDPGQVLQLLLGPAMGLLLQQRGLLPLHASAVELGGAAVAFAGDSGVGKSTVALALHLRGHRLLADDIAALEPRGTHTLLLPGHASVRLWPESLRSFGRDLSLHQRLHSETDKRLVVIGADEQVGEAPKLRRVYLLRRAERLQVEEFEGLPKALALLRHVYYPELTAGTRGPSALLQACVEAAASVRVFGLGRPDDLEALPELVERIARDG